MAPFGLKLGQNESYGLQGSPKIATKTQYMAKLPATRLRRDIAAGTSPRSTLLPLINKSLMFGGFQVYRNLNK